MCQSLAALRSVLQLKFKQDGCMKPTSRSRRRSKSLLLGVWNTESWRRAWGSLTQAELGSSKKSLHVPYADGTGTCWRCSERFACIVICKLAGKPRNEHKVLPGNTGATLGSWILLRQMVCKGIKESVQAEKDIKICCNYSKHLL